MSFNKIILMFILLLLIFTSCGKINNKNMIKTVSFINADIDDDGIKNESVECYNLKQNNHVEGMVKVTFNISSASESSLTETFHYKNNIPIGIKINKSVLTIKTKNINTGKIESFSYIVKNKSLSELKKN